MPPTLPPDWPTRWQRFSQTALRAFHVCASWLVGIKVHWGDFLIDLALLWIIASAIVKATYKGRIQAEAKAAQATETAEAESLKRQVLEARMAAMQAQVEPRRRCGKPAATAAATARTTAATNSRWSGPTSTS